MIFNYNMIFLKLCFGNCLIIFESRLITGWLSIMLFGIPLYIINMNKSWMTSWNSLCLHWFRTRASRFSLHPYCMVYSWRCWLNMDTSLQKLRRNFYHTWDPLVLGPELALERIPAPVCFNSFNISSWNFPPNTDSPPLPVPVGSPPCIMKSLIILRGEERTRISWCKSIN